MAYENRFKKGQSGNPKGRPRTGKSFAEIMRKVIDKQTAVKRDKDGNILKTVKGKEVIAEAIISIGMDKQNNANVRLTAFNTALDRAYGRPVQEVDMNAVTTVRSDKVSEIKHNLDKLSMEERELYLDLCEKVNDEENAFYCE